MMELAHLVQMLKSERVTQGKLTLRRIAAKWLYLMNQRLTEVKLSQQDKKRDAAAEQLIKHTWEEALKHIGNSRADGYTKRVFSG